MKNRRRFIKNMVGGLALTGVLPFSKTTKAAEVKLENALIHHVYFWLKEPENQTHKNELLKALNELIKVKTIKISHVGVPAGTENRDVVDHSYDVSYMVMFDSLADQDAYQTDPIHLKFVEENQHHWEKVIVYDSINA